MEKPDYGIDAPGVIRNLAVIGLGLLALAGVLVAVLGVPMARAVAPLITGCVLVIEAVAMVWSSRRGKLVKRDRVLDALDLRGDERVLDVGCGHGLLLIGAARRLPSGRAVGIDLWSQQDQRDNAREHTLRNARAEGVAERVEIETGDMRELPFADASFDAAVASLSIHNIPDAAGRARAVQEIARVLKPGGRMALIDFKCTGEYARTAREAGMLDVARSGTSFWIFPPVRVVTGRKG